VCPPPPQAKVLVYRRSDGMIGSVDLERAGVTVHVIELSVLR